MDVKRAADLSAQGRSMRQIGAELGAHWSTVSQQLQRAGVTLRCGVAKEVDMTVSGAWSRYRRARPPEPPRLGRWQKVLADALDQDLAFGVRSAVADHLGRAPTRTELTAA